MPSYLLTNRALRDVAKIITRVHREVSPSSADRMEAELFRIFAELAQGTRVAHRRPDLTQSNQLFYYSEPYMLIVRWKTRSTLQVLRVVHGASDISKVV